MMHFSQHRLKVPTHDIGLFNMSGNVAEMTWMVTSKAWTGDPAEECRSANDSCIRPRSNE